MPPQPGMFALPYPLPPRTRNSVLLDGQPGMHEYSATYQSTVTSTSRTHGMWNSLRTRLSILTSSGHFGDDPKKDKRRREIAGRLGKEMSDKKEQSVIMLLTRCLAWLVDFQIDRSRHYTESISVLQSSAVQLSARPETSQAYNLRMYPLSFERSAL